MREGRLALDPGNIPLTPLADGHFRESGVSPDSHVAVGSDGRRALRATDERAATTTYLAAPLAAPTPERLAEYAGTFRSPELFAAYTLAVRGDRRHLCRRKFPDQPLDPTIADGFLADRYQLDFSRDAAGRVDGFALSTGRARRLRFDRLA